MKRIKVKVDGLVQNKLAIGDNTAIGDGFVQDNGLRRDHMVDGLP